MDSRGRKDRGLEMIVIDTCPKCGTDLYEEVIDIYPPIYIKKCYNCGWSSEEKEDVIRIPYDKMLDTFIYKNETDNSFTPSACKYCSNHPSNGGSGICNCIMGSYNQVTC